ncbi:choline-phosphate cytidylyltransferase [Angomonas deanei]|uniref:CDP-alcohol phosphatidyltransferase, putative n=1 Tax=Angomonas deanei TaxID=59799 RepID=A0A7G2CV95_9TRYP|nr:choline-phosphate cytidylyltransferase [Angomonas deanei]CAD2222333.1 CDP-alcohol phosphatidyltransferase, putative [Angomonas deanei]|eukprot:EPY32479.1 choline-phosphate cytidylyltransferase [Angomonas deanei]
MTETSFLFTIAERESIYRAASEFNTRPVSFVTRLFYPLWYFLSVYFISELVAPNSITLVGVIASMQAYQIVHSYTCSLTDSGRLRQEVLSSLGAFGLRGARHNSTIMNMTTEGISTQFESFWEVGRQTQTTTVIAVLLLMVAILCGSVDGVHAKRCRSATSLGDIFSRACSSLSRLFIALTLLEVFHIDLISNKWYIVMSMQLIEFNTVLGRINANNLRKQKVKNIAYTLTYLFRDSELSFLLLLLLVTRWCAPDFAARHIAHHLNQTEKVRLFYISTLVITFINIALLKMKRKTKSAIAFTFAMRAVPFFIFSRSVSSTRSPSLVTPSSLACSI